MKFAEVSKGIPHIEDLPVNEFVDVINNLGKYQITEKVDGAQLLFGIDENGFYTSRETKGGTRIYNEEDYGKTFSSTYMRSAHRLLESVLPTLQSAGLQAGDQVEAEVLYGELPNVVPYSADTNYLIFLRVTEGSVNIDRLQQKLGDQSVSVSLMAPITENGRTMEIREETNTWKFARVPIQENSVEMSTLGMYINRIYKFLGITDSTIKQTYGVILETPLNKIPDWVEPGTWKDIKPELKVQKEGISGAFLAGYVMPIKEKLLDHLVRNRASYFGPLVEDGGWIEGVVLRHRSTGKMIKLVDKNVFGIIREQAWEKRNNLTEHAKSVDNPSSFMGRLSLDLATSLGHPELGTMQAKKYLRSVGNTTEERIAALSEHVIFESVRYYWLMLLEQKEISLELDLDKYEKEAQTLVETSGSVFGKAVRKRTLESYAQTFERITNLRNQAAQAKKPRDLIIALVGKQLGEL